MVARVHVGDSALFSDDCTLSAGKLGDGGICAKVFLEHASSAYFLGDFPLVPPFEEFQKMADFGVFAKLAIARTCGHFWSRGLWQNVVR